MLKELILINSANCDFAKIEVDRDLFFGGSNGTGKTTTIRALQYLFVSDGYLLGIDREKSNFKDYYFPDNNSYIVYVFEDFFIFMYRTSSGVAKYFSKQKFDINRIDGKDIKEIRNYIKEAELSHKADTIDEFRSILYGMKRDYLDFSLASVRDYKTFIKLFAGVFDIQRAITDTNSIKEAIYKSIDNTQNYEANFDSDTYLKRVYEFKSSYEYFKEFNKQKKRVEQSYNLKEEILKVEVQIEELKSKIAFRFDYEKSNIDNLESEKRDIKTLIYSIKSKEELANRVKEKFNKYIDKNLVDIKSNIQIIEKLKAKFSSEKLKNASEQYLKIDRLKEEKKSKERAIFAIEEKNQNLIREIDREIEDLRHSIKTIELELKEKLQNEKNLLGEDRQEELTKLDNSINEYRQNREIERESFDKAIDNLNDSINIVKDEIREIEDKFNKKFHSEKANIDLEIEKLKDENYRNKNLVRDREFEKKSFKSQIDDGEVKYKREYRDILSEFEKNVEKVDEEIKQTESMLTTKEGTFKEFLDNNVKNWETKLYPVMDKKLLSMRTASLNPEVLREDDIFGISLNMEILEAIPTRAKLEEKLAELTVKKTDLEKNFKNREKVLREIKDIKIARLQANMDDIDREIDKIYMKNREIEARKKSLENRVTELKQNIEKEKLSAKEESEVKLSNLNEQKNDIQNRKRDIQNKINIKQNEVKEAKREFEKNFQNRVKALEVKFRADSTQQRSEIETKVKEQESKKSGISANDKVKELKVDIRVLDIEIDKCEDSKRFLSEYESSKSELEKYEYFRDREKLFIFARDKSESRYSSKLQKYKIESKELYSRIDRIELELSKYLEGVEKLRNLELDFENIDKAESSELMVNLIRSYEEAIHKHSSDFRVYMQNISNLNKKLTSFSQIDIVYDDDLNERLSDAPNSRDFVDYLFEKLKSLQTYKELESERFNNFINDIDSKLENLSHKEDDLIKRIKRVNEAFVGISIDVLKDIKFTYKLNSKKSFKKISQDIKEELSAILSLHKENSLFFDKKDSEESLEKLSNLLELIKKRLESEEGLKFAGVDLMLDFIENEAHKKNIKSFKGIGSNGTAILLKIIIITAILSIYKQDSVNSPFFLIIDEIGAIEKRNQDAIREFANSHGFKTIFSTTNPILSRPEEIRYYRFARVGERFEVIGLNKI